MRNLQVNKKIRILIINFIVILFSLPFSVLASNEVSITDVTNFDLLTTDTAAPVSVVVSAGGQATNFNFESNYIDITFDNLSTITLNVFGGNRFLKITKQSGTNDYAVAPACPTDTATLSGTGASVVLRLEVSTTDNCGQAIAPSNLSNLEALGYVSVDNGNQASTTQVTTTIDLALNLTTSKGTAQVRIPDDTVITPLSGNMDFTKLTTSDSLSIVSGITGQNIVASIQFGIIGEPINFSQPVTIIIPTSSASDGQTFDVYKSASANSGWIRFTTCVISSGDCLFTTSSASYFAVVKAVIQGGGSSGGGGGSQFYVQPKAPIVVSPEEKKKILKISDFNDDKKVNIVDLSILLFHYGKSGAAIKEYDLNKDGKLGLADISIMFYYIEVLI